MKRFAQNYFEMALNRFRGWVVYGITMKMKRVFLVATASVISAVAVSSCAYQPHYSKPYYSSGYGYGYGSRNFTTVHFVRTSNPRWGYDPYTRCYYDYSRRCYYDPYLNGYYPVGYRPVYVQGAPHPHGWRTGHSYIAPPSRIYDHRLPNYQNRTEQYRSLNTDWSRNIKTTAAPRTYESNHNTHDRHSSYDRNKDSRSGSIFGSGSNDHRSRTETRDPNTYVNSSRNYNRPEPQSRQEVPNTSRPSNKENKEERKARPDREPNPNKQKGGRKNGEESSEAMLHSEKRENPRVSPKEERRKQASSDQSLRMVSASE